MKIRKIGALAALSMTAAGALAQSTATIYGVADIGVQSIGSGSNRMTSVVSGGSFQSRIGFRGQEDLGNGLKAKFNLESRIDISDGTFVQGLVSGGRSVVGLAGNFGEINLGVEYSPMFQGKTKSLVFGVSSYSETLNVMRGGTFRASNAVRYDSPSLSGFKVSAMVTAGDEAAGSSKVGRHTGAGVEYDGSNYNVVAAWNRVDVLSASVEKNTEWLVGGRYDFGPVTLHGTLWGLNTDNVVGADGAVRVIAIGATAKAGEQGRVMASLARRNQRAPAIQSANDATQLILGYEYSLSKRTTLYAQHLRIDNKSNSNLTIQSVPNTGVGSGNVSNPRATMVGVRHAF